MEQTTIYVAVLNEGTDVWRPVSAIREGTDRYRIVTVNTTPEDEAWEFPCGAIVRCKEHIVSGGQIGLVAYTNA
ncbi:MAG TPA: hypothetical protein VJM53_00495 [Burkholderiales bacterium]|nr:hypothetical protein [Burkholderiales bacterium]